MILQQTRVPFFLFLFLFSNIGSSVCAKENMRGQQQTIPGQQQPFYQGHLDASATKMLAMVGLITTLHNLTQKSKGEESFLDLISKSDKRMQIGKLILFLGVAGYSLKIGWDIVSSLNDKVPRILRVFGAWASKGFNRLCKRPNPLRPEQVKMWEEVTKNIVYTVCEQSAAGNVMLRNLRVNGDEQGQGETNWQFYIGFVRSVFTHIADDLQAAVGYYGGADDQRNWLVNVAGMLSVDVSKENSAFMIRVIVSNLKHMVAVCERAESMDDLDTVHMKKLGRNTLLLLEKLRILVGSATSKTGSSKRISSGFSGAQNGGGLTEH